MRGACFALFAAIALAPVAAAAPAACPIDGDSAHWIADWCMATLSTDDEIVAGDCIATELRATHGDECATRRHYKHGLCALAIERGLRRGSIEACVGDASFRGSVVRGGGVGGS